MSNSKYMEIYEYIKKNIINENYLPGEKIPSENQLKDFFSVSRNTVRKAIELLASDGYLSSIQGKGVFVMKKIPVTFLLSGNQSFKESSAKNRLRYSTSVPVLEAVVVDEKLSEITHFPVGELVYHLVRVREINGEKIILDENYFLKDILKGLTPEIACDSIYEFLEEKKGVKINGAQKIISVEKATELDKEYLDLNKDNVVVIVKNFAYLENGLLFEYTESHHRSDKFVFTSYAKREK